MARDYKERPARKKAPRKARAGAAAPARWPWFLAGLCLGVAGTAVVFVYEPGPALETVVAGAGRENSASEERPPRFTFYTLLPEKEIAIPQSSVPPPPPAPASAEHEQPPAAEPGGAPTQRYILQVGSFRELDDADRLKARLALLGLESRIQTVSIDGTETWHRVRVGPYSGGSELEEARGRLRSNDYEALLLKLR